MPEINKNFDKMNKKINSNIYLSFECDMLEGNTKDILKDEKYYLFIFSLSIQKDFIESHQKFKKDIKNPIKILMEILNNIYM